jgi:hypothetical protein
MKEHRFSMQPGDRFQITWTSLQTHRAVITAAKLAEILELGVEELDPARPDATAGISLEDALSWIEGTRTTQDIVCSEVTVTPYRRRTR